MTVTVEHDHLSPYGTGNTVPMYRCHCGLLHNAAGAAHQCRHRLRPIPVMPDRHEPATPSLFDQEDHHA